MGQLCKPFLKTQFIATIDETMVLLKRECSQGWKLTSHYIFGPPGLDLALARYLKDPVSILDAALLPPTVVFPVNTILSEVFAKKSTYIVRTGTDMLTDVTLGHFGRTLEIHLLAVSEDQDLPALLMR